MSQYPPPNTPPFDYARPNQPVDPSHPLLAPARRAAVLMFILGGLVVVCGLCFGVAGWIIPSETLVPASGLDPAQLQKIESSGMSVSSFLHLVFSCAGVIALVAGVSLLVLGMNVRRGRRGAIVAAMVICGLITLYLLVNFAVVCGKFISQPDTGFVANLAVAIAVIAAFGLLLACLYQALQACAKVRSLQSYDHGPYGVGTTPYSPAGTMPLPPTLGPAGPYAPNTATGPGGPAFPVPPSGQAPVRYGYAQPPAPTVPEPPAGDAPVAPARPEAFRPAPPPDDAPNSSNPDQPFAQG